MKILNLIILFLLFGTISLAQKSEFHLDQVYKISPSGTIDLSCSDAKVSVIGSQRSDVHVKVDRTVIAKGLTSAIQDFKVEVKEENGNLRIREHKKGSTTMVSNTKEEYQIIIEAPQGVSFTLKGDDGDFTVKNVNGALRLHMNDATIDLADCAGNQFDFRVNDGKIKMDQGKGSLVIDANDAQVNIDNGKFNSVKATVNDGDLAITTSLTDNGDYAMNANDGRVELTITAGGGTFDVRHADGSVDADGNFKTIQKSENQTRLSLPNGSANVRLKVEDGHIDLREAK